MSCAKMRLQIDSLVEEKFIAYFVEQITGKQITGFKKRTDTRFQRFAATDKTNDQMRSRIKTLHRNRSVSDRYLAIVVYAVNEADRLGTEHIAAGRYPLKTVMIGLETSIQGCALQAV